MLNRRALGVLVAVNVAVAIVVAMTFALSGGDDGDAVALDELTTTTVTTLPGQTIPPPAALTPVTGGAPRSTTSLAALQPGAESESSVVTEAPPPPVTSAGAVLLRGSGTVRPAGDGCEALAEPEWTVECGSNRATSGELLWLVQTKGAATRIEVWRRGVDDNATLVLSAVDNGGSRFRSATVRTAELTGDGVSELVVGFRRKGGVKGDLAVDVVTAPGQVGAHRELVEGSALVSDGSYEDFARQGDGTTLRSTMAYQRGTWRITSAVPVDGAAAPGGDF